LEITGFGHAVGTAGGGANKEVVGKAAYDSARVGLFETVEALGSPAEVEGHGSFDSIDYHLHRLRGGRALERHEEAELAIGVSAVGVVRAVVEGVVGRAGHSEKVLRPVPAPTAHADMGEGSGVDVGAVGSRGQPLEDGGGGFLLTRIGSHGDVFAHALWGGGEGRREGGREGVRGR